MAEFLDTMAAHGIDVSDADKVMIGSPSGHTEINKADGSLRYRGAATTWQDMITNLFGQRLNSVAGRVDYDWEENAVTFASGGAITTPADRVGGNQEVPHNILIGSSITFKPHVHWFQDAGTAYELTMRWRLQSNGTAKNTTWTTIVLTAGGAQDVFTYVSGVLNQITRFPDITIDCGLSDTIQFQMARTDSLGGSMSVYFMDMHGEVDSSGSNDEIAKEV